VNPAAIASATTRMPTFCKAWPTARNPSGPISADTVIANGMALATSLGLELDAEAMLKLIHQGIDAK
jgi:hypothetical protein